MRVSRSPSRPMRGARYIIVGIRDLLVVVATIYVWHAEAADASSGANRPVLSVAAALLSALCGFLLHEWGHLLGAWAGRGIVRPQRNVLSPFLFQFDFRRSTRRAFLTMSFGGFAGTTISIALFVALHPADRLSGQLALFFALVGAVLTLVLEAPVTYRVLRGADFRVNARISAERGAPRKPARNPASPL